MEVLSPFLFDFIYFFCCVPSAYIQTTRALMITGSLLGLPVVGMLLMSMPCISLGNEPQSSKNKRAILGGVLILIVGEFISSTSVRLELFSGRELSFMGSEPASPPKPPRFDLLSPQMLTGCRERRMLNTTVFLPRVDTFARIHAHAFYMFPFQRTLPLRPHHIPLVHLLSSTPFLCPEPRGTSLPGLPRVL